MGDTVSAHKIIFTSGKYGAGVAAKTVILIQEFQSNVIATSYNEKKITERINEAKGVSGMFKELEWNDAPNGCSMYSEGFGLSTTVYCVVDNFRVYVTMSGLIEEFEIYPFVEKIVKNIHKYDFITTDSSYPTVPEGGGCLIATATYGSEMANEVQQLRELRDNQLLNTESGTSFMNTFNDFYYSFSPVIADYERENPVFKEAVKITLTPLISSLSILNYVDMNSEVEVLGYGISLILLNVGMYFGVPAIVIMKVRK